MITEKSVLARILQILRESVLFNSLKQAFKPN